MADISMSVLISRSSLALADLEINDLTNYRVAPQFLGGNVSYNRVEASSVFMDSSVTIFRTLPKVQEQVQIEVLGTSQANLMANIDALIKAFSQNSFTMTITLAGQVWQYQCEAADRQMTWTGPRFIAKQVQITFTMPRHPTPLQGPM